MTDREIMQQALEYIKETYDFCVVMQQPKEREEQLLKALEAALAQPEQAEKQELAVQHLWECIGRWSSYLALNGEKANLSPPEWLVDAVKAATVQPEHRFDTPESHIVKWSIPVDPNNFGEPLAQPEPVAKFDDPQVQLVYEILCNDEAPPKSEHWEGFIARRIVDALAQPEQEPVAWRCTAPPCKCFDASYAKHCAYGYTAPPKPEQEQEPEIVRRVRRYAGKRRESVSSPHINAKECIALANWIESMLAQPEQEELIQFKDGKWSYVRKPWVGLTDEQLSKTYNDLYTQYTRDDVNIADFILIARAIEAKLKEKNGVS